MSAVRAEPIARIEKVRKQFGSKALWGGLSFDVHPGEIVTLVGRSGSGKTTLLNAIGLLEKFDSGTIHVQSCDIRNASARKKRLLLKDAIGFLFQFHGLVDDWTVEQNLRVAQTYLPMKRAAKSRARSDALRSVGLEGMAKRRVFTLSGGEQQRVALARLGLRKLSLVLVDEPTSALDEENVHAVLRQLREFADAGAGVIVSTHDPRVVEFADRSVTV